jgi:hypothetical protein
MPFVKGGIPPVKKGQVSPRKGVPNKATREARQAIGMFVDKNADRLQEWLDEVAHGLPRRDKDGLVVLDKNGQIVWVREPNPERAFTLFQSVVEYHVPKLARQEISGPGGEGLVVQVISLADAG